MKRHIKQTMKRKTVDKRLLYGPINPSKAPTIQSSPSPSVKTRSATSTRERSKPPSRETVINKEVSALIQENLGKSHEVEKMCKLRCPKFTWFSESKETEQGAQMKTEEDETTTMWYHPTLIEYHKWMTVKKSNLPSNRFESSACYGAFVDRRF